MDKMVFIHFFSIILIIYHFIHNIPISVESDFSFNGIWHGIAKLPKSLKCDSCVLEGTGSSKDALNTYSDILFFISIFIVELNTVTNKNERYGIMT